MLKIRIVDSSSMVWLSKHTSCGKTHTHTLVLVIIIIKKKKPFGSGSNEISPGCCNCKGACIHTQMCLCSIHVQQSHVMHVFHLSWAKTKYRSHMEKKKKVFVVLAERQSIGVIWEKTICSCWKAKHRSHMRKKSVVLAERQSIGVIREKKCLLFLLKGKANNNNSNTQVRIQLSLQKVCLINIMKTKDQTA